MADLTPINVYTCHEPGCSDVARVELSCNNVIHGRYCHAHKTFARARHESWCGCRKLACAGCGKQCGRDDTLLCQGCDRPFCERCATEKWESIGEESGCAYCAEQSRSELRESDAAEAAFHATLAIRREDSNA